jgi:hypothetical protein
VPIIVLRNPVQFSLRDGLNRMRARLPGAAFAICMNRTLRPRDHIEPVRWRATQEKLSMPDVLGLLVRAFSSAPVRPAAHPERRRTGSALLLVTALVCVASPALAQFTQQGSKLVGTGATGAPNQGRSVALSNDGNTLIVGGNVDGSFLGATWAYTRTGGVWSQQGTKLVGTGGANSGQGFASAISADGNTAVVAGPADSSSIGAVWIFVRNGSTWSQQGGKLVGTGAVGNARQGASVAISADGNTVLVGGILDSSVINSNVGAAWVFTRSGTTWTQQGGKLIGTGGIGPNVYQGDAVALSADGNTAVIGGSQDNGGIGAVWAFTRSGTTWTQQGAKLIGAGAVGAPQLGTSLALSADGNTLLAGGYNDNSQVGAAWVFTRSGSTWSQQGGKLVGTGGSGGNAFQQGRSVALSANGNIAVLGGPTDNNDIGSTWVFTRSSGGAWSQQGNKLTGSGYAGLPQQGWSVAISGDGTTLATGGIADNSFAGAAWVFTQPVAVAAIVSPHDFNGDSKSDILWRDGGGNVAQWLMNGGALLGNSVVGNIPTSWSVVGQRDFDGNGKSDILWRDGGGNVAVWLMNGSAVSSAVTIGNIPANWSVVGTGDFDGNSKGDILWRDGGGNVALWLMNGTAISSSVTIGTIPANWNVVGTADFDGNGKADILWRDGGGNVAAWFMNGATVSSVVTLGNIPANWNVVGTGDFDGNGKADILWRDGGGNVAVWFMNGATLVSVVTLGNIPANWSVAQTGDYNGDGKTDILWRDGGGNVAMWQMNGATLASVLNVGNIPANWNVQGLNAD